MATKLKDSATAERAALKLNEGIEPAVKSEPNALKEKTTSERLFPDFTTEDGAIVNRPIRNRGPEVPPTPAPAAATPEPVVQGQTPETQPPTQPIYLTEAELKGKLAKLKVDGVEQDVPAEELIKLKQLERHSNAQLMKVAQERAQMEREKQESLLRSLPEAKPPKQEPPVKKAPEIEALEARLAQMEAERIQERAMLLPQFQEAGIKRIEQMAKERLGTDDYRSYHERIKSESFQEIEKARAMNDPNWQRFDSDGYYFQKYQEMKLKDLMAKPPSLAPTNPTVPVLQTQEGAPVVTTNNGKPVSMPHFESSSGVPSTPSDQANWQSTYARLLKTAIDNPTNENWVALMRHKFQREA